MQRFFKQFRYSLLLLIFVAVNTAWAASFDDISKSLVVIRASNGKQYLCAVVKMDDGAYAVTSQSLFMNPIPKFSLKSFASGKSFKPASFELSRMGDFVRMKLKDASGFTSLELSKGKGGKVYTMEPESGIIYTGNAGGGNLNNNNFNCMAGSPIISNDGKFVGVASWTDDGFGKREEIKVAAIADEKWAKEKSPSALAKQVYSIPKMIKFTKALENTRNNFGKNQLIEIDENTHPKLMGWYKDQNKHAFERSLAKQPKGKKGSMGKAMREHQDRCVHYANLKRLASFFSSNAQLAKKARWKSAYLRNKGKRIFEENNSRYKEIRNKMKGMVEMYPSLKAKL